MENNEIIIREYQPGDEDYLIPLFNKIFLKENPNHVIMDEMSWKWKFKDNPSGFRILVACDTDNRIIGQMGLRMDKIKYYNSQGLAYTIGDVCLDENFRNKNFTSSCFNYLFPQTDFISWGFPSEELKEAHKKNIPEAEIIDVPIFHKKINPQSINHEIKIHREVLVEKEINQLWHEKNKEIEIGVIRDWPYVNWRIINGPEKMELFIIRDDQKVIGYCAMVKKNDICLINDILILNNHLNHKIFQSIENKCLELGYKEIQIMITDNYLQKNLLDYGFEKFTKEEINQKGYFICRDPKKPYQKQNFYLTWADSDWYLYDE